MFIVSSSEGSSTVIGWNLLSSALSFSIYFLYSFKVVAPIIWISPLAKSGFRIFAASIAPSAAPAPTIVWISSIKIITSPTFLTSFNAFFILSSKSPLYLAPATIPDISSVTTLFSLRFSGTSPWTIFWASPSIIAVFPTPGSPIRHGLFFVLLESTCIILSISTFLPITGSNFPSFASLLKSLPNWLSVGVLLKLPLLFFSVSTVFTSGISYSFITFIISLYSFCGSSFNSSIILTATLSASLIIPISKCSVPIYSDPSLRASRNAFSITLFVLGVSPIAVLLLVCPTPISSSIFSRTLSAVIFWFSNTLFAIPVPSFTSPYKMCSVPT